MSNTTYKFQKVMVVDDTYIDRYVAETVLKKNRFAHEIISVETAIAALEYLEANQDDHEQLPQLIFLDINMPGMNGFEFLDRYDALPGHVKKNCIIMMLTTSLAASDREAAENNRYVSMFLNKPLNREKLEKLSELVLASQECA